MHRGAWRGLLCHRDKLLERGDLRLVPPFGWVGGRRAGRLAEGEFEGGVVAVMDWDRRLRFNKPDRYCHIWQEEALSSHQYARTDHDRFVSQSMVKSVVGLLIGIAIAERAIKSLDDIPEAYVPGFVRSEYGRTPLRDLLHMSSGIDFGETRDGGRDLNRLWNGRGSRFRQPRWERSIALHIAQFNQRIALPGTRFYYASVEPDVLGMVLHNAVTKSAFDYLREKVTSRLRPSLSQAERAGFKEQMAAVEQRLKLADAASSAADRTKDELEKQFQAYKAEVAAKGSSASPAKVDAAIVRLTKGNTLVKSELMGVLRDLEYGALKKLGVNVGAPFIGIDGEKKDE
jgi:CubicO group peptidase (beta-lactamase class C family)